MRDKTLYLSDLDGTLLQNDAILISVCCPGAQPHD